jgi:hypothetical protein
MDCGQTIFETHIYNGNDWTLGIDESPKLESADNAQNSGKFFDWLDSIKPNERTNEQINSALQIGKIITFLAFLVLVAAQQRRIHVFNDKGQVPRSRSEQNRRGDGERGTLQNPLPQHLLPNPRIL